MTEVKQDISLQTEYFKDRYVEQISRFNLAEEQASKLLTILAFLSFIYFRCYGFSIDGINVHLIGVNNIIAKILLYAVPSFVLVSYILVLASLSINDLYSPARDGDSAETFIKTERDEFQLFVYNSYVRCICENTNLIDKKKKLMKSAGLYILVGVSMFVFLLILVNNIGV